MKNLRLLLLAALVALGCLGARAEIEWLETTRDFGAFDEDLGPVVCTFRFVNRYFEPVSIVSARASCGCTTPTYPRESVAPGDTAAITVTYDPAGRPGRFSKYVAVVVSDKAQPVKLYLKGTVVGSSESVSARFPVDCGNGFQLAKGVLMTGEVAKGQMRTVFLEGYNRSTDTIRPVVTGIPPYFEIKASPEAVAPGEQMSFICYFRSAKCPDYGIVNDTIMIATAPGDPAYPLPTVALVREDFSKLTDKELAKAPQVRPDPETVDFGRLRTEPQTLTFTIGNTGKSPLKIRRAYTADRGVSVSLSSDTVKPGKKVTATVTVDPTALLGTILNARIALITNDPAHPNTSVRIVGEK